MPRARIWNANIHYHQRILDAIPAGSARVLDVGCGDGMLGAEFAAAGVPVVVGLDVDFPVLKRARTRHRGLRVAWVQGDVLAAPLAPGSFDAVVSVAALHHMDATRALPRFAELVRPGGTVAIVGLAACDWWDWPYAALSLSLRVALRHRHGSWKHTAPMVWPPPLTYREMRDLGRRLLPGSEYRRLLLGRYSLVWRKPTAPVKPFRQPPLPWPR